MITEFNLLLARSDTRAALAVAEQARARLAGHPEAFSLDLLVAEAALLAGEQRKAAEALEAVAAVPAAVAGPIVPAQAARLRAQLEAGGATPERADDDFKLAAATFDEYGLPFLRACTQQEHAEWLISVGRVDEAEPLVADARETFERLRATPWLERADRAAASTPARVPA
jgi:hypothetical protein